MWDLIALIGDLLFPTRSSANERALPAWVGWTMLTLVTLAVGILIWSLARH